MALELQERRFVDVIIFNDDFFFLYIKQIFFAKIATSLDKIGCTKPTVPVARFRRQNCPTSRCLQIGYQINVFTYLPLMDIAYDLDNKTPLWSHTKIVPVIHNRQKSIFFLHIK